MYSRDLRDCVSSSKIYRQIVSAKNNGKVLENGDIRVGDEYAINKTSSIMYKLKK